ncbi:hypothetical protein [Micromonospora sp. IBHARD004]
MAESQENFFRAPHTVTALPGSGHFPHMEAAGDIAALVAVAPV